MAADGWPVDAKVTKDPDSWWNQVTIAWAGGWWWEEGDARERDILTVALSA